ncbi:MAG TPA: outer membrane beta-barrel protein, partial [Fimbriiglobus sp.]
MILDVLFAAGLALAQPPAPLPPPVFVPQPMISVPVTVPGDQSPAPVAQAAPMGQAAPIAPTVPCVNCAPEAPVAPKYLAERLLEGTRLGDFFAERGIRLYGWTEMSYTYGTADQSNAPQKFVDRAREFLFNQNYLVFEKPIDFSRKEFQIGFRSDTIAPGSDARFTIPRGLFDYQLEKGYLYPFDNTQQYAEIYMPNIGGEGTTLKVGRFYNPAGYESIMATVTPFLTRSYDFQYNALTYTGVLATTYLSDSVSVNYGATFGSDVFVDTASRLTFIGGLKIAPAGGCSSLAINVQVTNPKYDTKEAFADYNSYNVVYTQKLTDRLTYAIDATASHMTEFPGTTGAAWWYGAAQYLNYAVTDCMTGLARVEVFQDDKGVRTGTAGTYTDVTVGAQWKLNDSI